MNVFFTATFLVLLELFRWNVTCVVLFK